MSGSTAILTAIVLLLAASSTAAAQAGAFLRPEDVASPEAIVAASYEAVSRRPGENFDWARLISLFLPSARLIPNTEQTGGEFRVMTAEEFRRWVDEWYAENAPIGGPDDKGFQEEQIHAVVHRYGDIAHVLSTYQKRFWGAQEILGRGINSFQLVHHDGRWWIAGIVWDEESGAGPIPAEYLPGRTQQPRTPADGSAGGELTGEDIVALRELEDAYVSAWLQNRREAVLATLAEDAVLLPEGVAPVEGIPAIEAFWWPADGSTTTVTDYRTTSDEIAGDGNVAFLRGRGDLSFTWTTADSSGGERESHSAFLSIARKGPDGSWRIARRMWHQIPQPDGS